MLRRTLTGSLAAVAVTAATLAFVPTAHAAAWTHSGFISQAGQLPTNARVAVADNGAAVAAWIGQDGGHKRVMVASATNGVWGQTYTVSDAGKDASAPSVAINEKGAAVVTWLMKDISDHMRLASARRLPGLNWDGRTLISPIQMDVTSEADIDLDGSGRLVAVYGTEENGPAYRVRGTTQAAGTHVYESTVLSDDDAFMPRVAVSDNGYVLASYYDVENGQSQITSNRLAPGSNTWTAAAPISTLGQHGVHTDVAISTTGLATVVWTGEVNGDMRVRSVKVYADGDHGSAAIVSPGNQDATRPTVDQNEAGTALAAWESDANGTKGIGWGSRKIASDWNAGALSVPVANPIAPKAAISESGKVFIGYSGNGRLLASHRTSPIQIFTNFDSGPLGFVDAESSVGMDAAGNTLLAGVMKSADPTQGRVYGSYLDNAGPTASITAPTAAHTLSTSLQVGWKANDLLSPVKDATVRVRSAAWNGGFGAASVLAAHTVATTVPFTATSGSTRCFTVQARDVHGHLGTVSGERCTTIPVDDRTMAAKKGFKRAKGKANYLGTVTTAKKKGATLTLKNVRAKRLALVVAKAPKGGKVLVKFAGQKLRKVSLKGKGNKHVVNLATFGSVRTGTLVVKVISKNGKVVRVDGVVAAK